MHQSRLFASLTAAAMVAACGSSGGRTVENIRTLSNRADLVSGGDVLVEVVLKPGTDSKDVRVLLNGATDVTSAFSTRADGRFLGVVSGLRNGSNSLSASIGGGARMSLSMTNHPLGGPVFSGPQLQPWVCEPEASNLGPAVDDQCNVATPKVDYLYKSTDPAQTMLLPYDAANPPLDVAQTTTDAGMTVPFIVRRETGTINRGIYSFAFISDPKQQATPAQPPVGWNGALFYIFQGGALPQHRQGPVIASPQADVLAIPQLAKGYATAASSLTIFGQNTNSVVSAETLMMVKEKVAESIGEIQFTLSMGGSGGSIQQNLIVNAYPGLIDGINPSATYADVWSTNTEVQDCSLLVRYFDTVSPALWTNVSQQNAVMDNGDLAPGTCRAWVQLGHLDEGWANPESTACHHPTTVLAGPRTSQPWMYSASNPKGARCTLQDYQRNIFGTRPDGFAGRAYDNVGVQYGLEALKAGMISVDQFLDLNEKVGGRDINWGWTAQRTVADPDALTALYRTGQMNLMNNAASTPILDEKLCINLEIHSCFHSYKMRERLRQSTGSIVNHVLVLDKTHDDLSGFDTLAAWVRSIKSDKTADTLETKVARHKPANAVDACWINGRRETDPATCAAAKPYFGDPRTGAGAPITVGATKCQLTAPDRASYGVSMTDEQWARLQAIFTQGVCDWSKPGVEQTAAVPWLSFANGPGGTPIGPEPTASRH
ncbi:hypothetical protein D187_008924 [Cystobacter fuscus DSM 2262]|uniref:DUF6351 domain-containing protein n=1 Tax=Cystobacter fuscus (strain ATCC 25194 / DSM 2262 / NBRC 100088 / M29) TaxID=1242864 RepID=S9PI43_CYSF2|nr:DUF6351 family protein [Cystobacter fuscus]EPX62736.1 hypothetical protein D187_008924 [Cystobacter fuscus DSM 2262]